MMMESLVSLCRMMVRNTSFECRSCETKDWQFSQNLSDIITDRGELEGQSLREREAPTKTIRRGGPRRSRPLYCERWSWGRSAAVHFPQRRRTQGSPQGKHSVRGVEAHIYTTRYYVVRSENKILP